MTRVELAGGSDLAWAFEQKNPSLEEDGPNLESNSQQEVQAFWRC